MNPKIDWAEPENPKKKQKAKSQQAPSNAAATDKLGFIQGHFMPLGWDSEDKIINYYFYVSSCKSIVRLIASKMSKQNLLMLAPLEFWTDRFTHGQNFDALCASDFLITLSHTIGYFSVDKIRGRGAWIDNDKVVLHAGTQLIINAQRCELGVASEYMYEMRAALKIAIEAPMKKEESARLTKMLMRLNFKTSADARLLAGWIAIAPLCGALNWRPHIWLTGTRDSGKSWVLENVINKMLGQFGVCVQGNTTEMGIAQRLNNDAFPVTFDEAEGNNERATSRMEGVLALSRSSSSRDGAAQVKGSKDGKAIERIIRSCFLLSSINPQITLDSDKRRFCIIEIAKLKDNQLFKEIDNARADMINTDYVQRFQARFITMLPALLRTISTFVHAITAITGNKSTGDQIGTLLGGWWHTLNDEEVAYEVALLESKAILESLGTQDISNDSPDELRCLQVILSSEQRIEGEEIIATKTIGELVELASCKFTPGQKISSSEANDKLKRLGLQVIFHEKVEYLCVLNQSIFIKTILQKSGAAWVTSFAIVLGRIKGAIKMQNRRFSPGVSGRCIGIPLSEILN